MLLFKRDQSREVRSLVLNLVNANCIESQRFRQDPRLESRVNLSIVVKVVPLENGQPRLDKSFTTVTKDFASTGVSLVLNEPHSLDEVILAFRKRSEPMFVRARVRHLSEMGSGFHQLGLKLTEVVYAADYPDLKTLVEQW
jgi:hypothetical protein